MALHLQLLHHPVQLLVASELPLQPPQLPQDSAVKMEGQGDSAVRLNNTQSDQILKTQITTGSFKNHHKNTMVKFKIAKNHH